MRGKHKHSATLRRAQRERDALSAAEGRLEDERRRVAALEADEARGAELAALIHATGADLEAATHDERATLVGEILELRAELRRELETERRAKRRRGNRLDRVDFRRSHTGPADVLEFMEELMSEHTGGRKTTLNVGVAKSKGLGLDGIRRIQRARGLRRS